MASIDSNGRVICTGDELWSAAPGREDLQQQIGGSDVIVIWPKSRTVVFGAIKYPPLTVEQFDLLKSFN